jgi:P27 family predicted phage terminase small subunit
MGSKGKIGYGAVMNRQVNRTSAPEPDMPKGLDVAAQNEWTRITDLLRTREALDALDQAALADYLTCWQRLQECEAEITQHGVLVEGANGRGRVKNPACQLARQYRDSLLGWSREFGFTLSSRMRIDLQPAENACDDAWVELELSKPRKRV